MGLFHLTLRVERLKVIRKCYLLSGINDATLCHVHTHTHTPPQLHLHNWVNYLEKIFLYQFCVEVKLKALKRAEIKSSVTLTFCNILTYVALTSFLLTLFCLRGLTRADLALSLIRFRWDLVCKNL